MRNETIQAILRDVRLTKLDLDTTKIQLERAQKRIEQLEEKLSKWSLGGEAKVKEPTTLTYNTAKEEQAVEILNKPWGTGKIVKINKIRAQVKLDSDKSIILRSYPKLRPL